MAPQSDSPSVSPNRSRARRPLAPRGRGAGFWIGIFVVPPLLLIALIVGAYFYLTSDGGIRSVVLPEVSKRLGIQIVGSYVEWSPMRYLRIDNLRIGPAQKPFLTAKTLIVAYDGDQILKGNYHINRIELQTPVLQLTQATDGSFVEPKEVMDQFAKAQGSAKPAVADQPTEPEPIKVIPYRISVIQIKDMELTYVTPDDITVLKNLKVDLNDVRPEGNITLDGSTDFSQKSATPSEENTKDISGNLVAKLALQLDYDMIPRAAKGDVDVAELRGKIGKESIDGYAASLKVDLTTPADQRTVLKEAQAIVKKDGKVLTSLNAMGPVDLKKQEADLDIQIGPIRSDVLNVMFGEKKLNFLDSSLRYVGHLTISKGGKLIIADGKLEANPLNLASPEIPSGAWKPINLIAEHTLEWDVDLQRSYIKKVHLDAQQEGKPLLKGNLSKPMLISWADQAPTDTSIDDAEFTMQIFPTDLIPLKSFLGLPSDWTISSGILDAQAKVLAQNQGRTLNFDGVLNITKLAGASPHGKLTDAVVTVGGRSSIADLKNINFKSVSVKILEKTKDLATGTLEGYFDLSQNTGQGKIKLEASIPDLLNVHPVPDLTVASGSLNGTVDWKLFKENKFYVMSDISAKDLNLLYSKVRYTNLSLEFSGATEGDGQQIKVSNAQLSTFHGGQPGGILQGSLVWDSRKESLTANYQVTNIKTPVFYPIFAAYLPEKQLQSIDLSSKGDLTWADGTVALKATADVKNLLVKVPNIPVLKPLNAKLSTDLRYKKDTTLTLDSLSLILDPTPTAKNLVQVSGVWRTLPYPYMDLEIKGETIDATPYYDQLMPTGTTTASSGTTANVAVQGAAATVANSAKIPTATQSETRLMVVIDSLKIRDFILTEVKVPFRQKNDFIELQNAQVKIGGIPILATITSEGVGEKPTFKFNATTEGLQIGPLCDTLMPETKGLVDGKTNVKLYGSGKGLAKGDLDKSLEGIVELAVREAHLQRMPSVQSGLKKLGDLLQSPDIAASTVDTIDGSGRIGNGRIHTDNLHIKGSAVELTLRGDLMLDQQLKMEAIIKVPDAVLNRSSFLAQFVQPGTQPGQWVRLPSGINIGGTLSAPEPTMDKNKFIQGGVVNMLGNILFPKKKEEKPADPQQPAQPQQQQPAEEKPKLKDVLKKLF